MRVLKDITLPKNWEIQPLSELVPKNLRYPIGDGDHGQIKPENYQKYGIPYIRVADIVNDKINTEKMVYISKEIHNKNKKGELHPGDIIIAKTGATIGKVAIIPEDIHIANTTASIGKITPDSKKIISEYLMYYIKTPYFRTQMFRVSHKSAQAGFNIDDIKNFEIIVPPKTEQQNIVNILETCESAIQKRKEANRLTDEFLKSTFLEMFGDPIKNEMKWTTTKGKELFVFSSGKSNPIKGLDDSFLYPTYGGNGITGYSKEFLIDYDTIVIGRVGVYCGNVYRTKGKVWITDNAIFVKKFKRKINLHYLSFLLTYLRLNRFASYSGQPKITQTPLENMLIPLPSSQLQQKFADIVQKVEKLKQKQSESEKELNNLFNSLMQKAFRGEL